MHDNFEVNMRIFSDFIQMTPKHIEKVNDIEEFFSNELLSLKNKNELVNNTQENTF